MSVVRIHENKDGSRSVLFNCPGCECMHAVTVSSETRPIWKWNGSHTEPTFQPSILSRWIGGPDNRQVVCHSFVENGMIRYLGDSTHKMAGTTVALPELD